MTQENRLLSILFADITDSTKLYETEGDARARQLTSESIGKIAAITGRNGGRVIKTMGDGLMATFPDANSAFGASVEMQEAHKGHKLSITVGFHYGQVIEEGGDVFGDAVNLAARVASKAKAGEILLTEDTVNALMPPFRMATRFLDKTTVKGKAESINIYTVLTEGDDEATVSLSSIPPSSRPAAAAGGMHLVLSWQGKEVEFTGATSLVIGRDETCDLSVATPYASRRHAVLTKQRDRFQIADQSTNGTYIKTETGEELFLKREAASLVGSGFITLGEKPDSTSPNIIKYRVKMS